MNRAEHEFLNIAVQYLIDEAEDGHELLIPEHALVEYRKRNKRVWLFRHLDGISLQVHPADWQPEDPA